MYQKFYFSNLMLLIIIVGCTKQSIIVHDFRTDQIIHCSQMKNIENISDYVIYLNKGDRIPLRITLDSEVIHIDNEGINVILKQKIYFRLKMPEGLDAVNKAMVSEEYKQDSIKSLMIYLSTDGKSWVQYTDINAVKKVLGMQGEAVSFGMGITKEAGLKIFLNAKTTKM